MTKKVRYRGRISQTSIYLGKLLRMFIYQNDWKVFPMAAIIAGLVIFAVGNNIFKTQEGTLSGCFSLVCVCIWNGFFNSIQSVCRERPIIKREHRSGMHITSYIAAHMIYQLLLCAGQTAITIGICMYSGMQFPSESLITGNFLIDFSITLFLITYAADMMSLAISCIVKNTTTAMTVMPFMLMFQLVFSGGLIYLDGAAAMLTDFTIAKWGLNGLCTLSNYNGQPMVTLWNTLWQFRNYEVEGVQPIKLMTDEIRKNGMVNEFLKESGAYAQKAEYLYTSDTVYTCWIMLGVMILVSVLISIAFLEFIDRDKR